MGVGGVGRERGPPRRGRCCGVGRGGDGGGGPRAPASVGCRGGCITPAGRPAAGVPRSPSLSLRPARPPWPPRPALPVPGGLRCPSPPCLWVPSRPPTPGSGALLPLCPPAPAAGPDLCPPRPCPYRRRPFPSCVLAGVLGYVLIRQPRPAPPRVPRCRPLWRPCVRPQALLLVPLSFPCHCPFPALCPASCRPLLGLWPAPCACPRPLPLALVPCQCPCPRSLPRVPWPVPWVRPWALPLSPPVPAPRSHGRYPAPPALSPSPPGSRAGRPAPAAAAVA